jgi:hypothetical protein
VISADPDAVIVTRKAADPATTSTATRAFPTYTLGGSAAIEVPL